MTEGSLMTSNRVECPATWRDMRSGVRWTWRLRGIFVLAPLVALLGCAAQQAGPVVPANLPLKASDQAYQFQYALQRGGKGSVVRAVGMVQYVGSDVPFSVTLELLGVDSSGTAVSRGQTEIEWTFDTSAAQPFRIKLTPTGTETRYAIRVIQQTLNDQATR
jgi:hypothetical protein